MLQVAIVLGPFAPEGWTLTGVGGWALAAGGIDESKVMHDFIIVTPAPCGVLPLCACALVVLTSPFDPHSSSRLLLINTAMR